MFKRKTKVHQAVVRRYAARTYWRRWRHLPLSGSSGRRLQTAAPRNLGRRRASSTERPRSTVIQHESSHGGSGRTKIQKTALNCSSFFRVSEMHFIRRPKSNSQRIIRLALTFGSAKCGSDYQEQDNCGSEPRCHSCAEAVACRERLQKGQVVRKSRRCSVGQADKGDHYHQSCPVPHQRETYELAPTGRRRLPSGHKTSFPHSSGSNSSI